MAAETGKSETRSDDVWHGSQRDISQGHKILAPFLSSFF